MAYIDSRIFDIYSDIREVPEIYSRSFECDDLVAPVIAMLNIRGYKTKACCSGHPYQGKSYVYSVCRDEEELPGPAEELTNEDIKRYQEETKQCIAQFYQEGKKVYKQLVESVPYKAYISFVKPYFDENTVLPEGWFVDGETIRYTFEKRVDPYYFFTNQVSVFMSLYDWAQKLPYRSKVNAEEW